MIDELPTGAIAGVVISAVAYDGLSVTFNGRPAQLAVINEAGEIVAIGRTVAREAEGVAVNNYRQFLIGKGHLRVLSNPIAVPTCAQGGTKSE